jgi:hypothetical protein
MTEQLDFFAILPPPPDTIEVQVFQEGPDTFCATIAGGWWMAIGSTVKDAIRQVKSRYEQEQNYFADL